jgi:hypothetical protein
MVFSGSLGNQVFTVDDYRVIQAWSLEEGVVTLTKAHRVIVGDDEKSAHGESVELWG